MNKLNHLDNHHIQYNNKQQSSYINHHNHNHNHNHHQQQQQQQQSLYRQSNTSNDSSQPPAKRFISEMNYNNRLNSSPNQYETEQGHHHYHNHNYQVQQQTSTSPSPSQQFFNLDGVMNSIFKQNFLIAAANTSINQQGTVATQSSINQKDTSGSINYSLDENKCHVCGDKSTGSHFGGISCESCKAFFRRSVQRNRFEDYKCSYSGECKMNTNTRKICQFCRYKRCLSVGMRPKWVLSDDERHQKYGNRRKQNKLAKANEENRVVDGNASSPSNNKSTRADTPKSNDDAIDSRETTTSITTPKSVEKNRVKEDSMLNSSLSEDDSNASSVLAAASTSSTTKVQATTSKSPQLTKSDINKYGVMGVEMRTVELNAYEKDLIDRLSIAFYHSRKYNALDLNIQKKLSILFESKNEEALKKISKVILANFIVQPVKRVITFSKLIPDFCKLIIDDQMSLLQGGAMEIFICSSSTLYDQMSNKFNNILSKDRNIEGNDNSNIQLDMLRLIWSEEVFEKTIMFLKSMNELNIDEATLILFLPLILFSPDRKELKDKEQIYKIQSRYSLLLKKYMIWKFGKEHTSKLYQKLLLKLIELRSLHELHSSILLDADPTQLDPFPLAILSSEKEGLVSAPVAETATTSSSSDVELANKKDDSDNVLNSAVSNSLSKTNSFSYSSNVSTPESVGSNGSVQQSVYSSSTDSPMEQEIYSFTNDCSKNTDNLLAS